MSEIFDALKMSGHKKVYALLPQYIKNEVKY